MKIILENTMVAGFLMALRGMRNPASSWNKTDSTMRGGKYSPWAPEIYTPEYPFIGPEDMKLCQKLVKAGPEHAKFLRQIQVWVDITIPRYIWQELDTYKIGTVRNSCSTRPSELKKKAFTTGDFIDGDIGETVLEDLNNLANEYRDKKDKELLRKLKKHLPEGYLQKATYSLNYQNVFNIRHQRKSHWLSDWQIIIHWIDRLPYVKAFLGEEEAFK